MTFLKATTTDGKTELFNLANILTIQPQNDRIKILMGAGLYWHVWPDSIEFINLSNTTIKGIRK